MFISLLYWFYELIWLIMIPLLILVYMHVGKQQMNYPLRTNKPIWSGERLSWRVKPDVLLQSTPLSGCFIFWLSEQSLRDKSLVFSKFSSENGKLPLSFGVYLQTLLKMDPLPGSGCFSALSLPSVCSGISGCKYSEELRLFANWGRIFWASSINVGCSSSTGGAL